MIHKEGFRTLIITAIVLVLIVLILSNLIGTTALTIVTVVSIAFYLFIISFFRNPNRSLNSLDESQIFCPADGKVVVVEKAYESEFFKEERLQISVFMSPLNVHVNRAPLSGKIAYKKYHSGKYLAAWNPKSSTENERCTIVIDNGSQQVLVKQIAGALARRIVNYMQEGKSIEQGKEIGFIKFGSRVDLFLPLSANVKVSIGDVVRGNIDVLAEI